MKRYTVIITIMAWIVSVGLAPGSYQEYAKAKRFARGGKMHFAFMHYNKIVRSHPHSKYRDEALFASGEYYYRISGLKQSAESFEKFIHEYPESNARLYAMAYLLDIASHNEEAEAVQELEQQIIELQQVSLIFRDKKEITYRSPMHINYKAVIQIDKIEFYAEGELFAKVAY